jgi:methyl-accepting chemotaxis protein
MRETTASFRRPDYERANAAIDSILSQHTHDVRAQGLRRQVRVTERRYKTLTARERAKAAAVENVQTGLTQTSAALQQQARQQQSMSKELERLTAAYKGGQVSYEEYKAKYTQTAKALAKAQRVYERGRTGYRQQAKQAKRAYSAYEAMSARAKAMYEAYDRASTKYRRFTKYVPYQPA